MLYARSDSRVQQTETKTSSQTKPPAASSAASAPEAIQLPGAPPMRRLDGDYTRPDSLWVVVSKDYPLSDPQYTPPDLELAAVPTRQDKSNEERSVRVLMQQSLSDLFGGAKAQGHDLIVASGFRSYELQQTYFSGYSRTYGEEAAQKFSARPGQSEHQTGLAVDISLASRQCYLETCFGETAAGKWLAANAAAYGFVVRYPADKTEVTKYQYEPWHFRYVGKELAEALQRSGLTLDEARQYLLASTL